VRPSFSTCGTTPHAAVPMRCGACLNSLPQSTTGARYSDEPAGLLALDPQLVCYSGITGEPKVGFVVFVSKRLVEIQYLRATIAQEQRERFGEMVASTVRQIEATQFPARSGIRFPPRGQSGDDSRAI